MRLPTCTAQRRNGSFCDSPTAPDMPFPICAKHAVRVYMRVREFAKVNLGNEIVLVPEMLGRIDDKHAKEERRYRDRIFQVYYLDVHGVIKIGYTSDLRQRLMSYPPGSKLLATEPGDYSVEARRHRQFQHLLKHGKEWFEPGPDLLKHIELLRVQQRAA